MAAEGAGIVWQRAGAGRSIRSGAEDADRSAADCPDDEERRAHRPNRHDSGRRAVLQRRFRRRTEGVQDALAIIVRAKLQQEESTTRLNLTKVAMREGKSPSSPAALSQLSSDAERKGLKFEAVEYSLLAGEAEFRSKRYEPARTLLESAASRADQLGARALVAQAHHLLELICAATNQPAEARRHAATARQALDAIRKDARDDQVLQRSDLKPILQDSAR